MKGSEMGLVVAMITVLLIGACMGDFDLGRRIVQLERRVAELERVK